MLTKCYFLFYFSVNSICIIKLLRKFVFEWGGGGRVDVIKYD